MYPTFGIDGNTDIVIASFARGHIFARNNELPPDYQLYISSFYHISLVASWNCWETDVDSKS